MYTGERRPSHELGEQAGGKSSARASGSWSQSRDDIVNKPSKRNHYRERQTNSGNVGDALFSETIDRDSRRRQQSVTSALVRRHFSSNSPKQSYRKETHVFDKQETEAVALQSEGVSLYTNSENPQMRDAIQDEHSVIPRIEFERYRGSPSPSEGKQYLEFYESSSEKGLEEERFPTYLSVNYPTNRNDVSDTQSSYSMLTTSSGRGSFGKAHPVSRNFDAEYPHLDASIRTRGALNIESSKKSRQRSRSSLRLEDSSPCISPGSDQAREQETLDSRGKLDTPPGSHYDPGQENKRATGSPRNSIHSNGQRRSSVTSHKSTRKDVSRLAILEETIPVLTSESGINLASNPSIAESPKASSNRSRQSSSGRGSQISQRSSKNVSMGDADSIGSATSIILRTQSRTSKSSGGALTAPAIDPNEEILVGDEKDLHDAARSGDYETVQQLLELGTDINCRNETDRTPIHWAAGNGQVDVMKIMLDRDANIEAADKFGMNALLWAAWFGHRKCVQMLLRAGAKPTAKNKNGYTFLHCAAQNNHMMAEDILTEDLQDFDRDITDEAGRTCIHVLSKHGRKEMLQKFINLHCSVNAKDKAENTPLHLAAKYGFQDLIPILVNAGANLEDKNSEHKTALHLAADEGKLEVVEELIRLDADVNAETEDEVCPLHLAVSRGYDEAAIALINGGADVDAGNKHNQTPLHYAVIANRPSITQVLTLHDADPNVQDARSETPLHLAAENGNFDITEILLRANVNVSLTDQRGKTPLDVAARGSFITVVDMILKAERHHLYLKSLMSHHMDYNDHSPENGLDQDLQNGLPKDISFKPDNSAETQHIRTLLYKLATKYLKKGEWRKLAFQWGFTDSQIQAIEEQYTGEKSFREHGYRMLLIWLNGCMLRGNNPTRSLFEGLVAIQRRDLAETTRSKANSSVSEKGCVIS